MPVEFAVRTRKSVQFFQQILVIDLIERLRKIDHLTSNMVIALKAVELHGALSK
jgi:hypothetical protein